MKRWSIAHYTLSLTVVMVTILSLLVYININEVKDLRFIISNNDNINEESLNIVNTNSNDSNLSDNIPHKHQNHIDKLESEAGISLSRLSKIIIRDEGVRSKPYLDTRGIVTIGVGRSLQSNGLSKSELLAIIPKPNFHHILELSHVRNGRIYIDNIEAANKIFSKPLDDHDISLLLTDDLKNFDNDAATVFGNIWNEISQPRKEAILDTLFNLGLTHFKTFTHFIDAVKKHDWNKASDELLLSEAARNHVLRYHRNASVIRTNDPKYFDLD